MNGRHFKFSILFHLFNKIMQRRDRAVFKKTFLAPPVPSEVLFMSCCGFVGGILVFVSTVLTGVLVLVLMLVSILLLVVVAGV
jgi:hypothetical protein